MKRLSLIGVGVFAWCTLAAQTPKDTIRGNVRSTVEELYKVIMPVLDRIEITGSSEASVELRNRWGSVVSSLRNNKESMAQQVMDLMVSPSGKDIDLNLIREFIDINTQDSITKITINPDFWINELNSLSKRLSSIMDEMTKQK